MSRRLGAPLQRNRRPAEFQEVDGARWPAEWHPQQCQFAPPGTACGLALILGQASCCLSGREKNRILAGHVNECEHRR